MENYLGNPNLKKVNTSQEYTKEQILEYQKCMNDPLFHDMIPCCNQVGKFSYASCNLPNKSLAVAALFARIAMLTLGLNNA